MPPTRCSRRNADVSPATQRIGTRSPQAPLGARAEHRSRSQSTASHARTRLGVYHGAHACDALAGEAVRRLRKGSNGLRLSRTCLARGLTAAALAPLVG